MISSRYYSKLDENKMEYKRVGIPSYSPKRISIIQILAWWRPTKSDRDGSMVPWEEIISHQEMAKNFLPWK